jgi:uncharacterized membrane protein YeaQ/YmgE (transglycosylase-associated protein family)
MDLLVFLLLLALSGLIVGGLARLAVPGPDPMSIWATIALGIAGSFVGGIVAQLLGMDAAGIILMVLGAVVVLLVYRRFVQQRPITGPGAQRP